MTSRLRAMYQAYDGDLTLCLVLGEIASRNTERFYDERRGYQPASFNGQKTVPALQRPFNFGRYRYPA